LSDLASTHGLLRSSLVSGGGVVGRRRVDVCSAEGIQAAAASFQRQESLGDGASPRGLLTETAIAGPGFRCSCWCGCFPIVECWCGIGT
jgi:hypothetical protein